MREEWMRDNCCAKTEELQDWIVCFVKRREK
jgi:hypothetical protein